MPFKALHNTILKHFGGGNLSELWHAGDVPRRVHLLPGDPPREITLVEVTYPPGTGSPPHSHPNGVMAFVVAGAIASKVGDQPEQVFHEGEAWWEPLGAVHRVSRNASSVEPATLLAIYIASPGVAFEDLHKLI